MSDKSHFAETVHHLWENKIVFGLFFITMFLLSFALLYVLDLVPEELRVTNSTQTTEPSFWEIKPTQVEEKGELPVRISIASIGKTNLN